MKEIRRIILVFAFIVLIVNSVVISCVPIPPEPIYSPCEDSK